MSSLSPVYTLSVLGVAAYWLRQVATMARQRSWPRLGVFMPLGLAALLGAPEQVLDVPALFGLGLGLALIAAYYPLPTVRRAPRRADWAMAAALLVLGLAVFLAGVTGGDLYALLFGLAGALHAAALLLSAGLYPRSKRRVNAVMSGPERQRWQPTLSPDPPDLELSLEAHQGRVLNVSPYPLQVLGWSPARQNTWLPLRESGGEAASNLASGQTGYLLGWEPLGAGSGGLRLWYTRAGSDGVYLFRADWQGASAQEVGERVLN